MKKSCGCPHKFSTIWCHDPLHTERVDGVEVQGEKLLRLLGLCELSNLLLEAGVLLLQLRVLLLDALHRGRVLQRGAELLSHKTAHAHTIAGTSP